MGVINTTPDSFSDGGRYDSTEAAFRYARQLIEDGVDILDVGGESTRPGSRNVDLAEELGRTVPLIKAIRNISNIPISIDTNKPEVMRQAVDAGASIINSIWALRQGNSLDTAAELGVPVCLMHMQGTPETMQKNPGYKDVVAEVMEFLEQRIEAAISAGIKQGNIIIDPGFGFGKTLQHNLLLLKSLAEFKSLGVPLLVGMSRKSMIGMILDKPVDARLYGSIAGAVIAALLGADIVRVHDVAETIDAISIVNAMNELQSD
ncbi:MAG: dihydropteroate synthase [Gammaproteobacteria bacterium]|nr:dihydropteroate synthase [Gammaproteobacteria bacterium]MCZ6578035.1 dihydropteroate synthase [Gammaproteobacteria bacterium]MCZ6667237.1 dihydropteroate synthase [Gammaproteobacteria bacterium]MCZ6723040.1 dihydropteroate synthase [Gammaproteobacteria bacterium]MCZ6796917.1 dihydropteroate synthase [Gammaproteobacteria bacterium]